MTLLVTVESTARSTRTELVVRAQRGDGDAFGLLVDANLDQLARLACAIVGDESDSRDALQETLSIAWREIRSLREEGRFDAWMKRILINECRRVLRGRRARRIRETQLVGDGPRVDPSQSADDRLAGRDLVERALGRIDPARRSLLALHYLDEMSVEEIGWLLGIPTGTVKSRLSAARRKLRQAVTAEEIGGH